MNITGFYNFFAFSYIRKGPSIKYVQFSGWVGGTAKSVFLCTGLEDGSSNSVCTLLKKIDCEYIYN